MQEALDLYLLKLQAAVGTVEAALTGADDYFPALRDSSSDDVEPDFTPIDEVAGTFDQDLSVRGSVAPSLSLGCMMRSLGVSTAPDFAKLAQIAGMKETVTVVTGGNKYIYAPASDFSAKDATLWKYLGGVGSNGSILTKYGNIQGDWKITLEAGKPSKFELVNPKGVFTSDAVGTLPTPTKSRVVYPAFLGATVSINGVSTYKLTKAVFEGGNTTDSYIDPIQTYGYGASEIANKKGKFSLTLYADAALGLPSTAVLADAVESAITITYGPTGGKIGISCTYPQFTSWKRTKVGNLHAFDISGILTRNGFSVTANNDLT